MAIVQIDYTAIQNKQNSGRFLCIINNSRHYAQKTSALLYIFVHNDGSCAICTKNDRNVEAFCAKQKKLQLCNTCYKKVTKRLQNGYKHRKAPSAPPARLAYGSPYILYPRKGAAK